MADGIQFDRDRFLDAVHYIVGRPEAARFGRAKLHRALYLADMLTLVLTGRPLTGAEYVRQPFGPSAKLLDWALDQLEHGGRVRTERTFYLTYPDCRFESVTAPRAERFGPDERKVLDDVVGLVNGHVETDLGTLALDEPWQLVAVGEIIPYATAYLLFPPEYDDSDVAWAENEARALGLTR